MAGRSSLRQPRDPGYKGCGAVGEAPRISTTATAHRRESGYAFVGERLQRRAAAHLQESCYPSAGKVAVHLRGERLQRRAAQFSAVARQSHGNVEDRSVERGAGCRGERTVGDGAERSHGEISAGASVGAGVKGPGQETVHMVGAILPLEDLPWLAGASLRRARERAEEAQRSKALQGAAFDLPQEARTRFFKRERGEAKTPHTFRKTLLVLKLGGIPTRGRSTFGWRKG
ncbi:unnamed protein product [Lampetra planeri]